MAKIVIVEDEAAIRELIVEELEENGHEPVVASNGLEGLEVIIREKPDLVLSDITMPRMNGYQLLKKLRDDYPQHIQTPFIFLSALGDREDVIKGLRIGADDYVTKPIDFDLLLTRIDTRLRHNALMKQQHEMALAKLYQHMSKETEASAVEARELPALPGYDVSNKSAAAWINRIAGGVIVAGHVETISLDRIRAKLGGEWKTVADQVLRVSESVSRRHLDEGDLIEVTPRQDIMIAFKHADEDQAKRSIRLIAKEIWEILFGEFHDNEIAETRSGVSRVEIAENDLKNPNSLIARIENRIRETNGRSSCEAEAVLSKMYQFEDIYFHNVYTALGKITKLALASFSPKIRKKVDELERAESIPNALLATLDVRFLERAAAMVTPTTGTVMVPIRYITTTDDHWIDTYQSHFAKLDHETRAKLMLEVVSLPRRMPHDHPTIERLPGVYRTKALAIRYPAQLHGLDLTKLNIGILLARYQDVASHPRGIQDLLEGAGRNPNIKIIIEEVPNDASSQIRALGADLFCH